MNKYSFSAAMNAFYENSLRETFYVPSKAWPEDAEDISDEIADIYMTYEIPLGKKLGSDGGLPAWVDIPPLGREELIAATEQEQQRLLSYADSVMLDWRTELMLGEISDADRVKLSAWLAYKNDVKSVDSTTDPEHVNWPVPPEV